MHDLVQASAQYTDTEYNSDDHEKYRLSIQLRLDGFSFAVIEPVEKQLMRLQNFRLAEKPKQSLENRWVDIYKYFNLLIKQNHYSLNNFQKTIITVENREYTFMPDSIFSVGKEEEQLLLSQSIHYSFKEFSNTIPGTDRILIGAIFKPFYLMIQDYFESSKLLHSVTVLQNEIEKYQRKIKQGHALYISVSNHDMHMIAVHNEELLMSNSFSFTSKEDFVYFILLAYDQLKFNAEKDPIYFLGDISKSSPIYQISWQYIRNIHFIDHAAGIKAGSAFDQMPIHEYFILIQSALCE